MGYSKEERQRYNKAYRLRPEVRHKRRLWDQANNRSSDYRKRYGITVEQYNSMFETQEGCCLICKIHQSLLRRALNVDHDHKTKIVRGLLCDDCNVGLGRFKDNAGFLLAAASYLMSNGH